MFVYVVRHGQSETNVSGKRAGQTDVKLTPKGYEDAKMAGRLIGAVPFDRVFSSDLIRARETARTALPTYEPELDRNLREIDIGRIAGYTNDECTRIFGPEWKENLKCHNYGPYGGENEQQLMGRAKAFMQFLESIEDQCKNVAVFTHGGIIHCMFWYVMGVSIDWHKTPVWNGSVTIFELNDGYWRLQGFNIGQMN